MNKSPRLHPALKLGLDVGPLVLFFLANSRWGIFAGTAVFMVAVLAALAVSYALTRRLPVMALVSAVIVLVFGGFTLLLHDETFIKVKPTIIYALFGGALLVGYFFDKPLLEIVFVVGHYTMLSMVANSVGVQSEPEWPALGEGM